MTSVYVLAAVVVLAVLWAVITVNGFIRARNTLDESWSGMDVQLKRRHDLVPNLVATVKGYAEHESSVLTKVTEARAQAAAAASRGERAQAEMRLSSALGAVNALAEQYPQLRAAESFTRLQAQLAEVEDEIQAARRLYNANVARYNTRIQIFPNSVLAGRTFQRRHFFEVAAPAEREVPSVSFAAV